MLETRIFLTDLHRTNTHGFSLILDSSVMIHDTQSVKIPARMTRSGGRGEMHFENWKNRNFITKLPYHGSIHTHHYR
jgi:hypothetical protein